MERRSGPADTIVRASLGRHLAFAPVAFAVTEGPAHTLLYANAIFRGLQSAGKIGIGPRAPREPPPAADLTPLLDRVFRSAKTERDVILEPLGNEPASWSCTVW